MSGLKRLAVSAYAAFICLILINMITGPQGLLAYRDLDNYRDTIETNIDELSRINNCLTLESQKLMQQPDEIKIQARELGMVESDEGMFVISGYEKKDAGYAMGKLLSREFRGSLNGRESYIISMLAGLSIYIFSGFFTNFRFRKNN